LEEPSTSKARQKAEQWNLFSIKEMEKSGVAATGAKVGVVKFESFLAFEASWGLGVSAGRWLYYGSFDFYERAAQRYTGTVLKKE